MSLNDDLPVSSRTDSRRLTEKMPTGINHTCTHSAKTYPSLRVDTGTPTIPAPRRVPIKVSIIDSTPTPFGDATRMISFDSTAEAGSSAGGSETICTVTG